MQATMGAPHRTRHRTDAPQGACRAVDRPLTPPCGGCRHSHVTTRASRVDRTCAHRAATPPPSGSPPALRACRGGVPHRRPTLDAPQIPGRAPPPVPRRGTRGARARPAVTSGNKRGAHARRDQNRHPHLTPAPTPTRRSAVVWGEALPRDSRYRPEPKHATKAKRDWPEPHPPSQTGTATHTFAGRAPLVCTPTLQLDAALPAADRGASQRAPRRHSCRPGAIKVTDASRATQLPPHMRSVQTRRRRLPPKRGRVCRRRPSPLSLAFCCSRDENGVARDPQRVFDPGSDLPPPPRPTRCSCSLCRPLSVPQPTRKNRRGTDVGQDGERGEQVTRPPLRPAAQRHAWMPTMLSPLRVFANP